jgi:hypothetical protein
MIRKKQSLPEIVKMLSSLETSWEDPTSARAIQQIRSLPSKPQYCLDDIASLLDSDFKTGILVARLFLGISDDDMELALKDHLGNAGTGVTRYTKDKETYIRALSEMGLLDAMAEIVNRPLSWSDILIERLRSGRGKAIRGQTRGRNLEDFVENIVKSVFGENNYESRCQFAGSNGETAKCDFAIPNKTDAIILVEVKGYGATGSKMTDVIGDVEKILKQKRHDTSLILFTDGIPWKRRLGDLEKLVDLQNKGLIARIYTMKMANEFRKDLQVLKEEYDIPR